MSNKKHSGSDEPGDGENVHYVTATLEMPDGTARKVTFPKGTTGLQLKSAIFSQLSVADGSDSPMDRWVLYVKNSDGWMLIGNDELIDDHCKTSDILEITMIPKGVYG